MKKQYYILIFLIVSITSSCVSTHPDLNDGLYAQLETNKGDILIDLTFKETPVTVANFVSLSEGKNKDVDDQFKNKKYYDGLIFHRVIENFMIQGGDPTELEEVAQDTISRMNSVKIFYMTVQAFYLWLTLDQKLTEVNFL